MATTPRRTRTPRIRSTNVNPLLAITIACASLLCAPTLAGAATPAPNYASRTVTYAGGSPVNSCRGWGGDSDDAGNFYMACPVLRDLDGNGTGDAQAPALYELDSQGQVVRLGYLPSEYAFDDRYSIRDVGVAPDGSAAYVSVGPSSDNLGANPNLNPTTKQPMPNGATSGSLLRLTRQPDGSWLHDPTFKAGPFLLGDSYWAVRYVDVDAAGHVYVSSNSYVYELDPKSGATISQFGGAQTASIGGPWIEGFEVPEGLAVSADGSSILIVEQRHQLVQRWKRVGATDWVRDTTILLGVPSQVGDYCGTNDHFQSPYDVGTDAAGDIYVMDTTCQRVQRFTSAGAFVQTVWTNAGGDDWNHGFAVNWQGNVLLPIEEDILIRADPPAKPAPKPDEPDAPAPRLVRGVVRMPGSGCSRISPLRRVAKPATFRLVDRCAIVSGRVTKVARTRTGYRLRILLPAATAGRIWTGARAAMQVDVVTDRRTRITSTVRVGRPVTVVASIVSSRDRKTAWIMPVDRVTGR